MSQVPATIPNSFSANTKIRSAPVNANFTYIQTYLNNVYTSSDQTITAAGTLTFSHGLLGPPTRWHCSLVCQSGELGYSIGDVVILGSLKEISVTADTNQMVIRYSDATNLLQIPHKSTGTLTNITNASWKVRFYARL